MLLCAELLVAIQDLHLEFVNGAFLENLEGSEDYIICMHHDAWRNPRDHAT